MTLRRVARHSGRRWVLVALAAYVALLAAGSVLHHDLACHLKSPTHCLGCVISPAASRPEGGPALAAPRLAERGAVIGLECSAKNAPAAFRSAGRSPPA